MLESSATAGPIMAVWGFPGLLALAAVFSAGVLLTTYWIRSVDVVDRYREPAGDADLPGSAGPAPGPQ